MEPWFLFHTDALKLQMDPQVWGGEKGASEISATLASALLVVKLILKYLNFTLRNRAGECRSEDSAQASIRKLGLHKASPCRSGLRSLS